MSGTRADAPDGRATPAIAATKPTDDGAMSKPATIYDVAKVAGVSHQTVSRFLKGYEGIRPTTRERVIRALDELDYRPNLTARSLKSGRSHRIAALTHEINQVGPNRIVQGASIAARQSGFLLDIITLDMSDRAAIDEALELVAQLDVAGLIALASTDEMADAFEHADFRVPAFVAGDDESAGHLSELSTVGIPALISHLADLGHQRLLHIAGPPTWSAARNRVRAFDAALDARGLASAGQLVGDWSAASGYEAITRMPTLRGATAIVAANDQMALGAVLALTERGLAIPEDVSVTGIDDIPEAAFFRPPLTTLRIDFEAQGKAAVDQLLERIGHSEPAAFAAPAPILVTRQSTGPVSASSGNAASMSTP